MLSAWRCARTAAHHIPRSWTCSHGTRHSICSVLARAQKGVFTYAKPAKQVRPRSVSLLTNVPAIYRLAKAPRLQLAGLVNDARAYATLRGVSVAQPELALAAFRRHSSMQMRQLSSGAEPPHNSPPRQERKPATPGAVELRENILTLPNLLTISRMVATPFIGNFLIQGDHLSALYLLAVAGFTDLADGWLARRYNMGSVAGSLLDPAADKMLVSTLTVCLALSPAPFSMPVWLAVVILGRDVWLIGLAAWWRYSTLPPPKTLVRYWDLSIPSAVVSPTQISKVNTALQMVLLGAYVLTPAMLQSGVLEGALDAASTAPSDASSLEAAAKTPTALGVSPRQALDYFGYLVATTTIWSGLGYIGNKDAVKVVSRKK